MEIGFSQAGQHIASNTAIEEQSRQPHQQSQKVDEKSTLAVDKPELIAKGNGPPADISESEIESAVNEINDFVQSQSRQLNFSYDNESQRSVIKVTDSESGDVIRQIPSEDVLNLSERLKGLQSDLGAAVGVLFNKQV